MYDKSNYIESNKKQKKLQPRPKNYEVPQHCTRENLMPSNFKRKLKMSNKRKKLIEMLTEKNHIHILFAGLNLFKKG
jgi:hypothetical protein